jgi:hypothetical protein
LPGGSILLQAAGTHAHIAFRTRPAPLIETPYRLSSELARIRNWAALLQKYFDGRFAANTRPTQGESRLFDPAVIGNAG